MTRVNITELRKHLPGYISRVSKGEELTITSHGKILAKIVPDTDPVVIATERLKKLRGTAIAGDIISPTDTAWSADSDNL